MSFPSKKYSLQVRNEIFSFCMIDVKSRMKVEERMKEVYGWRCTESCNVEASYIKNYGCEFTGKDHIGLPNNRDFETFMEHVLNISRVLGLKIQSITRDVVFDQEKYTCPSCEGDFYHFSYSKVIDGVRYCEMCGNKEELLDLSVKIVENPLFTSLSEEELYTEAVSKGITISREEWREAYSSLKSMSQE